MSKWSGDDPVLWTVQWYVEHGKYMDRICFNGRYGTPYLAGDESWNRHYPNRQEWIDAQLDKEVWSKVRAA